MPRKRACEIDDERQSNPPLAKRDSPWREVNQLLEITCDALSESQLAALDAVLQSQIKDVQSRWTAKDEALRSGRLKAREFNARSGVIMHDGRYFRDKTMTNECRGVSFDEFDVD